MAYNPTNWECGDVVTAELLNKIEAAIESLSDAVDGLDERVTTLEGDSE